MTHNPIFISCEDHFSHQETAAKNRLQQRRELLGLARLPTSDRLHTTDHIAGPKLSSQSVLQEKHCRGITLDMSSELEVHTSVEKEPCSTQPTSKLESVLVLNLNNLQKMFDEALEAYQERREMKRVPHASVEGSGDQLSKDATLTTSHEYSRLGE